MSPMSIVANPDVVAIDIAGGCDRGKVREEIQSVVRHTGTRLGDLLVVADGIDGCTSSQAAKMAVETISSCVEGMPAFFPPEIAVEESVCHANAAIAAVATEPDGPEGPLGAAVVVALLRADPDHLQAPVQAIIGHVGDSRAYLVHNRKLTRLTRDHSVGQDLLDSEQSGAQDAETHSASSTNPTNPNRPALTRYLGQDLNVRVEMREVGLDFGDTLLLCSDGLWGYASEPEIERILADGSRSVEEASRALLDLALEAGGSENVAIQIARLPQNSDSPAPAARAVELRSAALPLIEPSPEPSLESSPSPVPEFPPAPEPSVSAWPISPLILENDNAVTEPPPPKRKKVFNLIRGFGRRISEKDPMAEKPASEEPAAPASSDQPAVSWAAPEPIVYGAGLNSMQLNATSSLRGKFLYTPGPGYVLPAGTHTLWASFHAAGLPEDNPVLASVPITVAKATPSLQWPKPSHVPPGVALGAAQLNASASVPGMFAYSPAAGEVLSEGTHTLSVTFTPKDQANYTTAQATVPVTVAKIVAEIDWTPPNAIPCGTPLGADQLNATASAPGTFAYFPAAGEVLPAGSHTLAVTFTPSDGVSYTPAQAAVPLTVIRGTPTIAWPVPEPIAYGTALNGTHLNATASVPGAFQYTPGPGAVLAAGEHAPSVLFTPSNLSDYAQAQAVIRLSVAKAVPAISWPAPEPINSATPLGSAQLNATASLPGTFAYSPAAGETLAPGVHTLSVTFTPADRVNYAQAHASVSLTVTEIVPAAITWPAPASISYGTALGDGQLSASSPVPGSFLYAPAAGDVLPPGEHTLSVIFTPEDQERYAQAHAAVVIIVEELPNIASLLTAPSQAPLASGVSAQPAGAGVAERKDDQSAERPQRETRTYKGAIYEKGDDGQWHLQRR
jgi:serine/threonine protein phosphatase PrpC